MKIIQIVVVFLLCAFFCHAQTVTKVRDVIASGGDYFQDNQLELKWTLGEVVTEPLEILSILLCQGFQQPDSKTTVPVIETALGKLEIKVYPNPAQDILLIEITGNYLWTLTAKLYDLNGKEYKTEVLKEHISQIDIGNLPASLYILRIFDSNGNSQSIQIIKQ